MWWIFPRAVPRAARYFERENHGALDHSALHLHIGDGRQFLPTVRVAYDVAIIDSPSEGGRFPDPLSASLRAGSRPAWARGDRCAWLPLHGLSEREFKILVRTFQSAFRTWTLWATRRIETYGPVATPRWSGGQERPAEG